MFSISSRPGQDWAASLNRLSLQELAHWFHSIGGNVFPLRYGTKNGFPYPWGRLTYTRLPAEGFHHLFAGACNLAVMMGAISQNLFVLDCETSAAFQTCISELERRSIPVCAVQTARGGHLYLRAVGVVQNIVSGTIPDIEVRGTNNYVLVPPSLHPSGTLYRFHRWEQSQPPLVDLQKLDFLTNASGQPLSLQMRRSRYYSAGYTTDSRLTWKTRDYLESGWTLSEGSRNVRLFSAVTDMLGCGFSVAEISNRLLPVATRSGLPASETHRTLENASRRPCVAHKAMRASQSSFNEDPEKAAQSMPTPQVRALWAFAMHAPVTPGRKGDSERRILLAMATLYKRGANAQGVFRGSQREWLELAHLSDHHASEKALQRLQQAVQNQPSILQACGSDKLSGARLWQVADWVFEKGEKLLRESTPREASVGEDNRLGVDTLNNADFLERGALGIHGYRIYEVLCHADKQLSLKQIAENTQLSVDTVRYHLREERPLRQQGLVQTYGAKRNRRYSAIPVSNEALNEEVAAACGTAGKSATRQAKHQEERRYFMAKLILRRMERSWTSDVRAPCSNRSSSVVDLTATSKATARAHWETVPVGDRYQWQPGKSP